MAISLLTTKLTVPPPRPNLVRRARLVERLDEGLRLGRRLTLVSAPAGFGKTTLLGDWASNCGRPVAWVSLEEGDGDPVRFWGYVVAALSFLLDHLPPQMHLVIAGRVYPPFPLARMRARGQLTELRADDLRFTPDEAAAFLNQTMQLGLAVEDVIALDARTEGWIAGLQLAAVALQSQEPAPSTRFRQGQEDVHSFIATFAGEDRYVLDYLTEEVLHQQPEAVRSFLLQTSILIHLSGPLCDAVTESDGSQEMLERLERANLFVSPLDNRRRWYRYHHLFADLLRHRLRQETGAPGIAPTGQAFSLLGSELV